MGEGATGYLLRCCVRHFLLFMPPLAGLWCYGLASYLTLDYLGCCVVQIIGLALPQELAPQVGWGGISDISKGSISGIHQSLEKNKNGYRII